MHELDITQSIVDTVAEKSGGQRVIRVRLAIGALSAVVPDAIRFCFNVCADGTPVQGALLEIEEIDGLGKCNDCGAEIPLFVWAGICKCGSADIRCIAGQELLIKEMEVV